MFSHFQPILVDSLSKNIGIDPKSNGCWWSESNREIIEFLFCEWVRETMSFQSLGPTVPTFPAPSPSRTTRILVINYQNMISRITNALLYVFCFINEVLVRTGNSTSPKLPRNYFKAPEGSCTGRALRVIEADADDG